MLIKNLQHCKINKPSTISTYIIYTPSKIIYTLTGIQMKLTYTKTFYCNFVEFCAD